MEPLEILNKLKKAVPAAVLEETVFGQESGADGAGRMDCAWVETRSLREVAGYLVSEPAIALDWLENLSVIQVEDSLVATYFLRSTRHAHQLVLRVSSSLASQSKEAELPSVRAAWAMAEPFEVEAGELFGILFTDAAGKRAHAPQQRLPKGWKGYPLRKTYVFPAEFLGIPHSRKGEDGAR